MTRAPTPLLHADRLSAGYGSLAAVRDLSLSVHEGEVAVLMGANGAGKTTTLLALAGDLKPMSGEIRWQGKPTRAPLSRRTRDGLALVLEERAVFDSLTTKENLNIGRGRIADALEIFPELVPHLKRRAGLLSGGQQQMLTLGRALAARPKVLLIDELSLGLAPTLVDRVLGVVRDAAKTGVGVLLVEQNLRRALEGADTGYILKGGQLALSGPGTELLGRIAEIERLYLANTELIAENGATDLNTQSRDPQHSP